MLKSLCLGASQKFLMKYAHINLKFNILCICLRWIPDPAEHDQIIIFRGVSKILYQIHTSKSEIQHFLVCVDVDFQIQLSMPKSWFLGASQKILMKYTHLNLKFNIFCMHLRWIPDPAKHAQIRIFRGVWKNPYKLHT